MSKEYTKSKCALPASNPWRVFGYGMEHIVITPAIAEALNTMCQGNDPDIWLRLQEDYTNDQKEIEDSRTKE